MCWRQRVEVGWIGSVQGDVVGKRLERLQVGAHGRPGRFATMRWQILCRDGWMWPSGDFGRV